VIIVLGIILPSISFFLIRKFQDSNFNIMRVCFVCYLDNIQKGHIVSDDNFYKRLKFFDYYYQCRSEIVDNSKIKCSCNVLMDEQCLVLGGKTIDVIGDYCSVKLLDVNDKYYAHPVINDSPLVFGAAIDIVCGQGNHTFALETGSSNITNKGTLKKQNKKALKVKKRNLISTVVNIHSTVNILKD